MRRHLAFASWLTLAGACAPFTANTPAGFVELPDQAPQYDYRATTADGVVLAARAFDNDVHGDEKFWAQALENRLRAFGGYALLESRPVTARGGLSGRQLRFGHDQAQKPHLYTLTVFVTKDHVYVLEAGGPKALMDRDAAKVDAFAAGFQPR